MSELLVRPRARSQASKPVAWVAVAILGFEAIAGLVGVSVLSYRAVRTAGFGHHPGSDLLGRTLVIVALLALVAATTATAIAILKHRSRPTTPGRSLAWAATTVLVTHALVVLGCLARAQWATATIIALAGMFLGGAWTSCLRHRR